MATPTGWSFPLCCSGEKTTRPGWRGCALRGLDVPHPLGDIVLEQAVFEVDNPQAVRDRWQALLGFPSQGEQGLDAGGQWFIFRQGPANQLAELVFRVANPALKGQRFRVGNGVYRFI